MIKAIETVYKGYRFRSRLEARWAVFFDALGIVYKYEHEGFDLDGEWYLPDFWMPEWKCWIEIKPDKPKLAIYDVEKQYLRPVVKREYKLCEALAAHSGNVVLLIGGEPWAEADEYGTVGWEYSIAVFSPVMVEDYTEGDYVCSIGLGASWFNPLKEEYYCLSDGLFGFISRAYRKHPEFFSDPVPCRGDAKSLIEADKQYYLKKYGRSHPKWEYGIAEDDFIFRTYENGYMSMERDTYCHDLPPNIANALQLARQERFNGKTAP